MTVVFVFIVNEQIKFSIFCGECTVFSINCEFVFFSFVPFVYKNTSNYFVYVWRAIWFSSVMARNMSERECSTKLIRASLFP